MIALVLLITILIPQIVFALTPGQVYERVKSSIVVVKAYNYKGNLTGMGSGVMLPSGNIVTNCHVLKEALSYTVSQGQIIKPATLMYSDPEMDLCLLNAPGMAAKPVRLGKAVNLRVGDPVFAVGAPQG